LRKDRCRNCTFHMYFSVADRRLGIAVRFFRLHA
jgi:hypothetical protein